MASPDENDRHVRYRCVLHLRPSVARISPYLQDLSIAVQGRASQKLCCQVCDACRVRYWLGPRRSVSPQYSHPRH